MAAPAKGTSPEMGYPVGDGQERAESPTSSALRQRRSLQQKVGIPSLVVKGARFDYSEKATCAGMSQEELDAYLGTDTSEEGEPLTPGTPRDRLSSKLRYVKKQRAFQRAY
mmetsp:Transcript_93910/g.201586  ORF Transcript_93910/g.201586 Transcript_93910/m.201586 type:complete len:111 (+) Transcript_93910:3-335(+)